MRAYETKTPEQAAEDARVDAGARLAGYTVGRWFGIGVGVLLCGAGLSVVGLVLFAAVRGIGRWLAVW